MIGLKHDYLRLSTYRKQKLKKTLCYVNYMFNVYVISISDLEIILWKIQSNSFKFLAIL